MQQLFSNVNWAEVVIGFLVGLTPIVLKFTKNFFQVMFEKSKLLGNYNFYHLSGTQSGQVRKKGIRIFKSYKGYLEVGVPTSEHTGLSFKGRVINSDLALRYISLVGNNHPERIFIILNIPSHRNFRTLTGVFVAINIHNVPLCGKMLLSKDELSDEDVKKTIGTKNLYADITRQTR